MNKRVLAALAVLVLAVGGYVGYTKLVKKDKDEKTDKSEVAEAGDGDTAGDTKTGKVPPPMSPQQVAVSMDDDPEGPLRLEGQVIDADGVGVPNAFVTLSSNPPRTIKAEGDGSFVFDKLVGRTYFLSARAGNLVGGPIPYKLSGEGEQAIIRMSAGGSIIVSVRGESTGDPISGASVELRTNDRRTETTGKDGKAKFSGVSSGWLVVVARAPGFGVGRQALAMPSTPGAEMKVELSLGRGAAISGVVVDDKGSAVEGAVVTAHRPGRIFDGVDGRYDGAKTDKEGKFRLESVPLGKVQLAAGHKEYAPGKSEVLDFGGDESGVKIELERGGSLEGKVVTAEGAAAPWANVSIRPDGDATASWGGQNRGTTADENGNFEFKGLPKVAMSLLAKSEQASSEIVAVDLSKKDAIKDLKVVLTVTGTISGKVVDGEGNDLAEVQVVLFPDWTAGGDTERMMLSQGDSATTTGDGSFSFTGLKPGTFLLKATRDTGNNLFWQAEGERVKTGDSGVELVLPANGKIKGSVVSNTGSSVGAFSVTVGWPPGHPFSDDSGEFNLDSIPPGKYDLKIRGANFAQTTVRDVEVKSNETTDIGEVKVVRGRVLKGRVVDASGSSVAGATIVMAQRLMGSGDSLSFSTDATSDEMMGIRRGTSDESGYFRIRGIPSRELVAAAEHTDKGRSRPMVLAKGTADLEANFTLRPLGQVSGIVRRGETPAPGVNVIVTPSEARAQMVMAPTDDKGAFNVVRLAEGNYEFSAVFGSGFSQQSVTKKITVEAGGKHSLDLTFEPGDVTLKVTITPEPGAKVDMTRVVLLPGKLELANSKELENAFLGRESSGASAASSMKNVPVDFPDLHPGEMTLCGFPITGDVLNQRFMARLQEFADQLKVVCKHVEITESPKQQTAELVVPEMDPLPEPEGTQAP